MAHYMAINKSGKNLPIFSGWPSVDKGNQIGTIYNREVFIYGDTEDGVEVYFRNSSGRIVQGFYYATDANGNVGGGPRQQAGYKRRLLPPVSGRSIICSA